MFEKVNDRRTVEQNVSVIQNKQINKVSLFKRKFLKSEHKLKW